MHVAVTAVGTDRPGIVAGVTGALYHVGANLEGSRMALLGGHFALVVIAALPEGTDADALRRALEPVEAELDLLVGVGDVRDAQTLPSPGESWVISVYGADKPGIVAAVSRLLADRAANITDLATHVGGDPAVYVMAIEVTFPERLDVAEIEQELRSLAGDLGVDLSMHPMEPETL